MKTDSKQFLTLLTVPEIASVLRTFKCDMQKLTHDALAGAAGEEIGDIEILMHGQATMIDAFKHTGAGKSEWAVQVYVYDLGEVRSVELVALGESAVHSMVDAYAATGGRSGYLQMANMYVNFRHSKDYRDRIMAKLQPIDESQLRQEAPQADPAPVSYSSYESNDQGTYGGGSGSGGNTQSDPWHGGSAPGEVFFMAADESKAEHGGICIQGSIASGELIRGEKIEVMDLKSGACYPTTVKQIYRDGHDTYLADDTSGIVSVLTDFVFLPFASDAELLVYKAGQKDAALDAYKASQETGQTGELSDEDMTNDTLSDPLVMDPVYYEDESSGRGDDSGSDGSGEAERVDSGFTINKKMIIAAALVILAAVIIGIVLKATVIPSSTYKSAQKHYEEGEYGLAYKEFAKLGDYEDSAEMKNNAGTLYWKTCYRNVLNGNDFLEGLSEYGYSVDDLNSMRSSFDLGYINDDDIPELALKIYKDVFIISVEEDGNHNLSAPEVCRMASGDYYTGIVEIGAYEKQGYIAYEYEENGSTYKEWVPYKYSDNMEEEPDFYREYYHSETEKDHTDYWMNDGSETRDLARDAFYDEVYKYADPDKYKEFKLKDNTEDNQNSVFS